MPQPRHRHHEAIYPKRLYAIGECACTGLHGGNRLASNSLIEAVVYADTAAAHSIAHIDDYAFNTDVPEWNDEGTMSNEEKVLIAQDAKEVEQIMSKYVGIVRSDLRLKRAWTRLDLLYEETEELFKRVKATRDICELRNKPWKERKVVGCTTRLTTQNMPTTKIKRLFFRIF